MAGTEIRPGAVLGDERYTLKRLLGAGGMASVWLAEDERLAREVAVKVIADTLASDERYRERFEREARAAASVSHPNIVPVYDYGLDGEHPFLIMEYVAGGTLADVLTGDGTVFPDPTGLARELLGALDCVHAASLVHRDVKPANILLDPAGRARLTDFGIAQPEDATALTQTGMVIGTLRYLAPEVIAGGKASAAADLYAAGVVLRELTERHRAPELSPLTNALTRAHPGDRPSSAAAALELLRTVPTETIPGTTPTRAMPWTARTRVAPAPAPPPSQPRRTPRPAARASASVRAPSAARIRGVAAGHGVSPRVAGLAIAATVILLLILTFSTSGGGSSPSARGRLPSAARTTATPTPATDAPLSDQLGSLKQIVDHAATP